MKRIVRIFRIALITVSTLICIASIAVWVRSRTTADNVAWHRWPTRDGHIVVTTTGVATIRGVLLLQHQVATTSFPPTQTRAWGAFSHESTAASRYSAAPETTFWERRGFGRDSAPIAAANIGDVSGTIHVVWFPLWLPAVAFAIAPCGAVSGAVIRRRRRARRLRSGLCLTCGYDLRSSVGRCPECGAERE